MAIVYMFRIFDSYQEIGFYQLKVLHVCYSDLDGGAARAAFRLHKAQRANGLDSHMLVVHKVSDDQHVHSVSSTKKVRIKLAGFVASKLLNFQKSNNPVLHSLNLIPSGIISQINKINPDVVNLHWLGGEMISINEISKIKQPIVWTLHDMWAFCGAEHYEDRDNINRYHDVYSKSNRSSSLKGLDLDSWIYQLKQKCWKGKDLTFVCPSNWMANCVTNSKLLGNSNVHVVSNCIDHEVYRPLDQLQCREILRLPKEKKLLLFGAMSSTSDPRKGYRYLMSALKLLREAGQADNIELVVFGASVGTTEGDTGIKTHYVGKLNDDISLVMLYSAADVFIAPSLQDNLPNTLVESIACGTQCIAFDIGGMKDLISSSDCGSLIDEIVPSKLAEEIINCRSKDSIKIVENSQKERDESTVSHKYQSIYRSLISND